MTVEQLATLVNQSTKEVLGKEDLAMADLSNVVDVGTELANANAVESYVRSLVNHIGKVIFVSRPYYGNVPSVFKDAWEFGSILEKIECELPEAKQNDSWELEDGTDYSPNVFYKPTVSVKFFNSKTTFEIDLSFTDKQVKQSFSNAEQLNSFISMLYNSVEKSMTVKVDSLIMSTINNAIAQVMNANYSTGEYGESSTVQAVNLLKLYNDTAIPKDLPKARVEDCLMNPDFLKFASMQISLYKNRLGKLSTLFNCGKKARFTPADKLHIVALNEFVSTMQSYLEADTFNNELVKLPNGIEQVPYWQGSGEDYGFNSTSKIHCKIDDGSKHGKEVEVSGVLAVMFDDEALGVSNLERRVTTHFNPKAEFYNNFYKFDCGFFNDMNENCVVFFVANNVEPPAQP